MTESAARVWLDGVWQTKARVVNWLGYENFIRKLFESQLSERLKLVFAAEALGAYTGRGVPRLDS